MWNILVLTVLISVAGYYATTQEKTGITAVQQAQADNLAGGMAVYREAVVNYFSTHPAQFGSVTLAALDAANVLPSWSTLHTQPATSIWANYRDTDGMIYIYSASVPGVGIL